MSKLFKIVRPESSVNPEVAEFEYLIRWVGRDGAEYQHLFNDAEMYIESDAKPINQELINGVSSIISRVGRTITLYAKSVSYNDMLAFSHIMQNRYIERLKKDGTRERYAPKANSISLNKRGLRYDVKIKLENSDLPIWK